VRTRWLALLGAVGAGAYAVRQVRRSRPDQEPPEPPELPPPEWSRVPAEPVARVVPVEASSVVEIPARVEAVALDPPEASETTVRNRQPVEPFEIPPGRGLSGQTLAGMAVAVGIAAIALGLWAFVTSVREQDDVFRPPVAPATPTDQTIALLSKPSTKRVPLDGSGGRIVLAVGAGGRGWLVLDGLPAAPRGKSYEAWVIRPRAKAALPAAVFVGRETLVPLAVALRPGSILAVTVERRGGVEAPTRTPLYVAQLA
jgi:Anti-sigma-K factor rskA